MAWRSSSAALAEIRRRLRVAAWNALLLFAGLALIMAAGEVWFRLATPFTEVFVPFHFRTGVGVLTKPGGRTYWTNHLDYWTVSQANSLGFLAREPPSADRAAASCHVTVIGDSFVEAREVAISDKLQVRLEELAARELPELDVTTSAFGQTGTGQIAQLAYYDAFARRLRPKLVVLVFVHNDFRDNGTNGNRIVVTATLRDGRFKLLPPDPDGLDLSTPTWPVPAYVPRQSRFARYLYRKTLILPVRHRTEEGLPPRDARLDDAVTGFALDQFKERTDRDGAALALLKTHTLQKREQPWSRRLDALVRARGIPVIDEYEQIVRRGGRIEDVHWLHDGHWNPVGHRWAAEAMLDYLKRNREICRG